MSKQIIITTDPLIEAPTGPTTLLCYGAPRSGKTRFAATAPRPYFFSDHSEGGWTTIQTMNRDLWWERDVPPLVDTMENVGDFWTLCEKAKPLIQSGRVKTIVVDSETFYADLYLAFLTQGIPVDKQDPRQIYGRLATHLREQRVAVHRLGANVIWTALEAEPDDDHPNIRPMIPGREGLKFGAGCSYIFYFRKVVAARDGKPPREHFDIFTSNEGKALAGGRDSGSLPKLLPTNTFRGFLNAFSATRPQAVGQSAQPTLTAPSGTVTSSQARPSGAAPRSFKPRQ